MSTSVIDDSRSRPDVPSVHPTALVHPAATLAANVTIGPFCQVGAEVVIEAGATLVGHVVVDGRTVIGAGATLYPFCTVGLPPQDLKYAGEPTRTVIGPRTVLREHCTVHRGTVGGGGVTRVGADCLLMAVVHVAHDCNVGDGVIIANNVVMGGHVEIGDHAVIGGASALHQFVRIGRSAMIGGVSGVEADVPPFSTAVGNRARLSGLNVVGLRRRGIDRADIRRLRDVFLRLFQDGDDRERFAARVASVRRDIGDGLGRELLAFVETPSRRGLIRRHATLQADEAE